MTSGDGGGRSAAVPEGPVRVRGVRPPASDGERRALASVVRLRILRMCRYQALTNKQIAERLQRDPATVLHHVRTLVTTGFLVAGDPRSGPRGSREVPYRATGRSWQLDFGEPLTPSEQVEQGGVGGSNAPVPTGLGQTMLQTFLEEVAELPPTDLDATRLGLLLTPEHHAELTSRIGALLDEFAGRPPDPSGQAWSIFLAVHPDTSATAPTDTEPRNKVALLRSVGHPGAI